MSKKRIIKNPIPKIVNIIVKKPGQTQHAIIKITMSHKIKPIIILRI